MATPTKIDKCNKCGDKAHSQDQLYGKGDRLHNKLDEKKGKGLWRCTVCGTKK